MNWKPIAIGIFRRLPRILGGLGAAFFGVGLLGLFAAPSRYPPATWAVQLILLALSVWLLWKGKPLQLPKTLSAKAPSKVDWPEEAPAIRASTATVLCPNCGAPGQQPGAFCEYCGSPLEP